MAQKILIVDDIDVNAELIKEILQEADEKFEILIVKSGEEGIKVARSQQPDIILMDWKMPNLDGLEAIRILKEDTNTQDIPVLMITAYSSPENLRDAFQLGVFDYIEKPVDNHELIARVQNAFKVSNVLKEARTRTNFYELKLEELRNTELVSDQTSTSFLIISPDGNLEWGNNGFASLHGYSFKNYIDKYGKSLYNHPELIEMEGHFKKCLHTKSPVTFIHKYVTENGNQKWLQTSISPKLKKNGDIESILVMENDVSLLKEQEEELNQQNEQMATITEYLEDANNLLEEQKKEISKQKLQIEVEQKKSEELLLNILPFEVARQLKSKGRAKPRYYKMVSVLFADFKGFSKFSKEMEPRELIQILDNYFAKFDEIAEKHFMEKIKTMGDAFMAAGGLPLRNRSNPINAVLAGLEIQHFMNTLNDEKVLRNEPVWELRLGIHTGPLVAGVVGRRKFAYDIWGDTVNIASRMEHAGAVGMINISESTYIEIKEYFECDHRGKIEAKGLGKIDMYFANRLKKQYSADELGLFPNEDFELIMSKL
ncbi:MAG: response regulator [Bacteroidetes bacterium]|jgi:PAS domain S-box-containing protein|nr:response regulator [Bacteroidota bacterium]